MKIFRTPDRTTIETGFRIELPGRGSFHLDNQKENIATFVVARTNVSFDLWISAGQ